MGWLIAIGVMIILGIGFGLIQILYEKNPEPFDIVIRYLIWIGGLVLSIYISLGAFNLIFDEKSIAAKIFCLFFGIGFGVTAINIFKDLIPYKSEFKNKKHISSKEPFVKKENIAEEMSDESDNKIALLDTAQATEDTVIFSAESDKKIAEEMAESGKNFDDYYKKNIPWDDDDDDKVPF